MTAITTVEENVTYLSHDPSAGGSSDFDVGGGNDITAHTQTDAQVADTPAEDEVIEITDVELIPPRNGDGSIQDWAYLTFLADGTESVGQIRAKPFQLPYLDTAEDAPQSLRTSLGVPVLRVDDQESALEQKSSIETTCPKYNYNERPGVRIQAGDTDITDSFVVRVTYRKFQGSNAELRNAMGVPQAQGQIQIVARNPYRGLSQQFSKTIPLTLNGFDQFSGGKDASPPYAERMIFAPTLAVDTAGQNKRTPFKPDNVDQSEDALWFNISQESQDAYVVDHLSLDTTPYDPAPDIPASLQAIIFELDHRDDEDDTSFRAVDDMTNELPAPMPMDGNSVQSYGPDMKHVYTDGFENYTVPQQLQPRETLFRDKGGLAALDDGSVIPAGSLTVGVWGYTLNLQ